MKYRAEESGGNNGAKIITLLNVRRCARTLQRTFGCVHSANLSAARLGLCTSNISIQLEAQMNQVCGPAAQEPVIY